jgi:ribosome-binding protein aMBF1 (putative translation factor)
MQVCDESTRTYDEQQHQQQQQQQQEQQQQQHARTGSAAHRVHRDAPTRSTSLMIADRAISSLVSSFSSWAADDDDDEAGV